MKTAPSRADETTLPAALDVRRVLIDGVWHETASAAIVQRCADRSRQRRREGAAMGSPRVVAAPGRYHLYVSYACPFAHRVILGRVLTGVAGALPMSVLHPHIAGPHGWTFAAAAPDRHFDDITDDLANGHRFLYEVYRRGDPRYTGRVSVPVLWDTHRDTMISNDSGEILRLLSTSLASLGESGVDLFPERLASEIERLNDWIGRRISNAVYRVGLAPDRPSFERERSRLFDALERLDADLGDRRYLLGDRLTESDVRLFVTLLRLDPAYRDALGCNLRRLEELPRLSRYCRRILRLPSVLETVKPDHIRRHYFDDESFRGGRYAIDDGASAGAATDTAARSAGSR